MQFSPVSVHCFNHNQKCLTRVSSNAETEIAKNNNEIKISPYLNLIYESYEPWLAELKCLIIK